jgi:hypothetical protein
MLDALSDFWKPMKKSQSDKLRAEQLQIGSAIVFGFVPQVSLSGRRLQINFVNTYQFGSESLTSFVLSQDREPGISMIVAESEGEQYLALSRRITISDRIKMFDNAELENVIDKPETTQLSCKDNPDFKGWTVTSYRREIQGMKGLIYSGDFRKAALPPAGLAQEFKYTLLASSSNEHAIEIEKYPDGRVEMYATVYRRTSDIAEVSLPLRPDLKLAVKPEEKPVIVREEPKKSALSEKPVASSPVKLQEFSAPPVIPAMPSTKPEAKPAAAASAPTPTTTPQEKKTMPMPEAAAETLRNFSNNNGAAPKLSSLHAANQSQPKQEIKTVNKTNGLDANDSIECDLRVANKIIEDAIRGEMRLSDVVRRVIELPVSHQEAVHIPVVLSDEDYSLLAIRYGISSSDKNAIKSRIIEDLNSFSGLKK